MSHPLLDQLGRGHGAVTASAGTGKTYFLEQLVLDEVRRGMALDRILVVTFTRKGTLELKERVRSRLQATAAEGPDAAMAKRLRDARRDLERATIATIHSFCQQALQEQAFEAGQPLSLALAPGKGLRARAFLEALRKGLAGPEAAAWEQALERLGDAASLERWLTDMLPDLDRLEPRQADLVALVEPFKDEALFAALEQARATLKAGASRNTFDAFLETLQVSRALVDDPAAFRAVAKDWPEPKGVWGGAIPGPIREVIENARAFPAEALRLRPLAEAVAAELAAIKTADGLVDFDDLIHQLRQALEGPSGEVLTARLSDRYDLCLLDEAQDTSEDQWAILWRLFNREGKRIVLVGDAKQAIFSFQGGDLPAFQAARRDIAAHGGAAASLSKNWRATPAMVEACNAILNLGDPSPLLIEPEDPVAAFTESDLEPVEPCEEPPVWELPLPAVIALPVPFRKKKEDAEPASAEALAGALLGLRAAAPRFRRRGEAEGRPLTYADVFVLVRQRGEADRIAEVFRERGVPFVQHKARGLYEGEAAEDLLALFHALTDPRDGSRRMRAFLTPFFGLSLKKAEGARELDEGHPLMQRLQEWARLGAEGRMAALFDRILSASGAVARLLAEESGQRRVADLLHLVELLQQAAGPGDGPAEHARRLVRWARDEDRPAGEDEDARRLEQEGDAVRILTLHAAKGLEAPVVALFGGLGEGGGSIRTPLRRFHREVGGGWIRRVWLGKHAPMVVDRAAHAEAAAEERRLLYVGLTRAQGLLLLPVHGAPEGDEKPHLSSAIGTDGVPKGPYGHIQRRLLALRDTAPSWLHWGPLHPSSTAAAPQAGASSPLVIEPFPFEGMCRGAWPPRTESFTSLHRRAEAARAVDEQDPEPDRVARADGLPGGAATGVALHAMLEGMAAETFDPDFRRWWKEERRAWAEQRCRAAGLDPVWAEAAARLAHAGFNQPLALPGVSPVALCAVEPSRLLRELDFLAEAAGGRLTGALDALFEHEGRVFILDWKSNRLPGYGAAEVAACVAEDYALQVKIYTLAVLRVMGIGNEADYEARFGGAVYVFLRGLPEGGQWAERPAWRDILAWQAELRELLEAGYA
ncbi:MAG TPA: UvrD-helicase domain-containing protein [Holophagaceae bacterium]|nr:UvrD-helicase domain-containing protein [Holophagaceae bacterium]